MKSMISFSRKKRSYDDKVLTYTVGVGRADQEALAEIASESNHHYHITNYNSIKRMKKSLLAKVCSDHKEQSVSAERLSEFFVTR